MLVASFRGSFRSTPRSFCLVGSTRNLGRDWSATIRTTEANGATPTRCLWGEPSFGWGKPLWWLRQKKTHPDRVHYGSFIPVKRISLGHIGLNTACSIVRPCQVDLERWRHLEAPDRMVCFRLPDWSTVGWAVLPTKAVALFSPLERAR